MKLNNVWVSMGILTSSSLMVSASASAQTATQAAAPSHVIKTCKTEIYAPGYDDAVTKMPATIAFYENLGKVTAMFVSAMTDPADAAVEEVEISEHAVRAVLDENTDPDTANLGEELVAMGIIQSEDKDPEVRAIFNAGIDLHAVRKVKVYRLGATDDNADQFGIIAVVEAWDENGKSLGSFLGGGLYLAPCKE